MKLNKTTLIITILALALLVSLSFVSLNYFGKYKSKLMLAGYQIAVQDLIAQAENKNCDPFSVYNAEKEINLINVSCLQQANSQNPTENQDTQIMPEEQINN